MTDYKQLCGELLNRLNGLYEKVVDAGVGYVPDEAQDLMNRAWDAMAEPKPEGPTEQEWDALVESAWDKYMTVGYQGERFIYEGDFDTALGFVREGLARWGNHPGSPDSSGNLKARLTGSPADGEVVELAETLERMSIEADAAQQFSDSETLARAADLLERLSPPQPVPVSERMPEEPLAWWFTPESDEEYGWWVLEPNGMEREPQPTHWLPAHTLPLPTTSRNI